MNRAKKTVLYCSQCGVEIRDASDLGFGYRGTPKVGDTHVCDRFQYGTLKRKRVSAASVSTTPRGGVTG
jgi:hypothetical protein